MAMDKSPFNLMILPAINLHVYRSGIPRTAHAELPEGILYIYPTYPKKAETCFQDGM